jgi:hypothetical protein
VLVSNAELLAAVNEVLSRLEGVHIMPTWCGVQELTPGPPVVLCVLHTHGVEALASGGVGLVRGKDTLQGHRTRLVVVRVCV